MIKSKSRKFSGSDRRLHPRLNPSSVPFLKSVAFNQGSEVQVIDISRGGMLLETDVRLRPQMRILLKIVTTQGAFKIAGCVLRSSVASLKGTPRFQSAISFEQPFHLMDDLGDKPAVPSELLRESKAPVLPHGSDHQEPARIVADKTSDEDLAILTLVADDGFLQESLKLNNW